MKQRLLTKSRFKLALECPNKLFYTNKKQYANKKNEDPFLQALAKGGFQVEELARLSYPGGVLIEGNDGNYDLLVEQTSNLLKQENIVIFEAAFKFQNLFIRTDILVKRGNNIELIEVKAKSYDPLDDYTFVGKRKNLVTGWKPYLFDVAFQKHVMQQVYPDWEISSSLMLANKRQEAQIDGLNQCFRVTKKANNRTGVISSIKHLDEVGGTVLGKVNIDTIVTGIQNGTYKYFDHLDFKESIAVFPEYYKNDTFFNYPVSFSSCKACEFRTTIEDENKGLKSGFKSCWSKQKGWITTDFEKPNTFEVWNFRKGKKLLEQDKIFLDDLNEDDVDVKPVAGKLSASERQWIQIEKRIANDATPYILKDELKAEMSNWKFPLNFIDFETSAVALPFTKGRRPYEQVAFQFSHHTINEDGKVHHASEYISFNAGEFPNFNFLRALKKALMANQGSIFKYATHENSILNAIYGQLEASDEPDKKELQAFIQSISHSKRDSVVKWAGERDMIDLCAIIKNYVYLPQMGGSNSIKFVLPAVLSASSFLQKKYSQPLKNIQLTSSNFESTHVWFQKSAAEINPYKNLPQLFEEWTDEQLESTISEIDSLANGGAALTAYGKLQYTNMSDEERLVLKSALLKYCELDTLAMVMIYEYLKEITNS